MSSSRWSSFASYFVCEEDCDPDISLSWPQTGAYVRTRHVLETPAPGPRPPRACLCLPLSPPSLALYRLCMLSLSYQEEKRMSAAKNRGERERERERGCGLIAPPATASIFRDCHLKFKSKSSFMLSQYAVSFLALQVQLEDSTYYHRTKYLISGSNLSNWVPTLQHYMLFGFLT